MKTTLTIKQAKECHPLAAAVLRQLGGGTEAIESAIDAANHGADGGFGGFIYYSETSAFTRRHRWDICKAVEQMADDIGEEPLAMVRGFRCLKDNGIENRHVALALYGGKAHDKDTQDAVDLVENALAWFALEEVGRAIENT